MAEKIDVENILAIGGLIVSEKIEEQSADARFVQRVGDISVARAQPAAAASMREEHDTFGALRDWSRSPVPRAERISPPTREFAVISSCR